MSIRPSVIRGARRIINKEPCIFCLHRSPLGARTFTIKQRIDPRKGTPGEVRADIDQRNRRLYFRMLEADKLIPCKLEDANKIINHFVSNRASMNPATNARTLAQQFKLKVIHLPMLAIPMFRIPDVNDTTRQLPPSSNAPLAASLLVACSAAGDLQATLQILNAVYYSAKVHNMPKAAEMARLYTPKQISDARRMLEQLAEGKQGNSGATGDANAMTLHGKFLELAGDTAQARFFYEKALERYDTKIWRGYPHPMALPWLTPWTELVKLEEASPAPSVERITKAIKFGALKADDPMAYYKLATLQASKNPDWLNYMSKAAASGHPEAMYELGLFYHEVQAQPSTFLGNTGFRKALNFITSWKRNGAADFGMEWLNAAATGGHKPAVMEMARMYERNGQEDQVQNCLEVVAADPSNGVPEEWPDLAAQARHRLAALKSVKRAMP
ncbi:hypothetical protein DPSP01_012894 [Paraphaeosphaeria sporulosa]